MQRVFWCACGQKMKVPPEYIGKAGRCVNCQRRVTLTENNTYPPDQQTPGEGSSPGEGNAARPARMGIPPLEAGIIAPLPPIEELPPDSSSTPVAALTGNPPPGPFVEPDGASAALPPLSAPPPEAPPPSDAPHLGTGGHFMSTPFMDQPPGPLMDTPPTPPPWQATPEDIMTPPVTGPPSPVPQTPVLTDTPSAGGAARVSKRDGAAGEPAAELPIAPGIGSPFDAALRTWGLVLEPQRLILATLATMVCATGVLVLSSLFGDIVPMVEGGLADMAGKCVIALWVAAWIGVVAGGVSWMVQVEEENDRRPSSLEGLSFIVSRSFGLASVLPGFALVMLVPIAMVGGGLKLLADLPGAGSFAVGLMTVPVFVGVAAVLLCTIQMLMVPCVMGTDGVPATEAARRVLALLRGKGRTVLSHDLMALGAAFPLMVAMWAIGGAAWHFTLKACMLPGADTHLVRMSMWFLGALCGAFWVVYAAVTHTVAYRCHREKPDGAL
jgi:hypothetical protein